MARASIVVVGGGISGLAAAWELSGAAEGPNEQTPRIELIEVGPRLGGSLATTTFAQRIIDLGADGFLAYRPEATALVRELGLQDQLEGVATSGASLWLRGALYEIPAGLAFGVPTSISAIKSVRGLSWRARAHAWRDQFFPARLRIGDDATIGEIVRAKLGPELAYQFVEPMVGGIQAGRIDQLSAKLVFPALLDAARKGGSLMKALRPSAPATPAQGATNPKSPMFYSLLNGVGSLPGELARQLSQRGVVLRTGVRVSALRHTPGSDYPWEVDTDATTTPADAIVLATPAAIAGALLGQFDVGLDSLRSVTNAGAAMATFSVARGNITLPEHGTGVLVPLKTPWSGSDSMMVTAITFLDRKWPHLQRDDDVLLRAHMGRIDDDRWTSMSDEEITTRITQELSYLLPKFESPIEAMVQRWPNGLPQYYVNHDELVTNAKAASAPLRVALAGNAYDGVGIPASIGSGRRAAREVLELLRLTRSVA